MNKTRMAHFINDRLLLERRDTVDGIRYYDITLVGTGMVMVLAAQELDAINRVIETDFKLSTAEEYAQQQAILDDDIPF